MPPEILLADDDEFVRVLVSTKLRDEYDVITTADGAEAWDRLTESEDLPSLAILDVMMPDVDGFTLLERIRADETFADLPVVMLTSRGREEDVVQALELGADDFVTKPFSPAELHGRVTRILCGR